MPRLEKSFKTEAIILRQQDYGEGDRLLSIFTPEYGKVKVIAKGASKPTGRKTGHVELFTRSMMIISRGHEIHVVQQAEMVESFLPLREDLERGAYAGYLVELLDHFTEFEETNRSLYQLLDSALGWLSAEQVDLRLAARYYELHLLSLVGFQPSLHQCAVGQEKVEPKDQFFSYLDGGVICPDHVRLSTQVVQLTLTSLKTLRYLQTRDYEVVSKLKLDNVLHLDLERLMQNYIVNLLERRLKSVEFIRRLRRMDKRFDTMESSQNS